MYLPYFVNIVVLWGESLKYMCVTCDVVSQYRSLIVLLLQNVSRTPLAYFGPQKLCGNTAGNVRK